jgi:hypothetical protein
MDPNNIPPQITNFVNQHYELWDNAHPNQMWTNVQKAIVNNFIMNRINDVIEATEDEHLGIEEIQEIYDNLVDLLDDLFLEGNNNPANVGFFQDDDLGLLGNDNNNELDDEGEHSPISVADKRLIGGKKRKRKTIKKRKTIRRRKSRRMKSRRRK